MVWPMIDFQPITAEYYDTKADAMKHHSVTAFHHAVALLPAVQPIIDGKRYTRRATFYRTNIYFDAVKAQQAATPIA